MAQSRRRPRRNDDCPRFSIDRFLAVGDDRLSPLSSSASVCTFANRLPPSSVSGVFWIRKNGRVLSGEFIHLASVPPCMCAFVRLHLLCDNIEFSHVLWKIAFFFYSFCPSSSCYFRTEPYKLLTITIVRRIWTCGASRFKAAC